MAAPSPNRNVMIVLAYLWPLAVVPLLIEKNDAVVQWHARHGLVLLVAEVIVFAAFGLLTSIISLAAFGLGCVVSLFGVFLWIATLAIHAFAIVMGINGKRLQIPFVSDYTGHF